MDGVKVADRCGVADDDALRESVSVSCAVTVADAERESVSDGVIEAERCTDSDSDAERRSVTDGDSLGVCLERDTVSGRVNVGPGDSELETVDVCSLVGVNDAERRSVTDGDSLGVFLERDTVSGRVNVGPGDIELETVDVCSLVGVNDADSAGDTERERECDPRVSVRVLVMVGSMDGVKVADRCGVADDDALRDCVSVSCAVTVVDAER
jgi:hypothetical protein